MDPLSVSGLLSGPEWQIEAPAAPDAGASSSKGGGFGAALTNALGNLEKTVDAADAQSNALATGQATDVSSVVMATERASLELQLATQFRNKAVDAYQEIFRMQI